MVLYFIESCFNSVVVMMVLYFFAPGYIISKGIFLPLTYCHAPWGLPRCPGMVLLPGLLRKIKQSWNASIVATLRILTYLKETKKHPLENITYTMNTVFHILGCKILETVQFDVMAVFPDLDPRQTVTDWTLLAPAHLAETAAYWTHTGALWVRTVILVSCKFAVDT